MNKDKIADICHKAGLQEVERTNYRGVNIFIADGYSSPPHANFRKFGVDPDEFPNGCYVTLWWADKQDEELDIGQPLFFDTLHDVESMMISYRQKARANAARLIAKTFIDRRRHVAING